MPVAEEKIVKKNYDHLKIEKEEDDLYISDFDENDE